MPDSWYFDLQGPRKDVWVWTRVAPTGAVTARCGRTFSYYLDALEDARNHGFTGQPKFGPPQASTAPSALR
jgi:hypothetical protein